MIQQLLRLTILTTTSLSITGIAHQPQQQPQQQQSAEEPTTPSDSAASANPQTFKTAEQLLDALDKADANLRDFSARILYSKEQGLLGDIQTRIGNLYFLNDNNHSKRVRKFRVEFERLEMGDVVQNDSKDYIFDGRWMVERVNNEKQFIRREVVQSKDDNYDPLAVDGPFPLPIGQSKAAVLKRFNATLLPPETEEGSLHNFYKLKLTPKSKARIDESTDELLDESIQHLTLWYDPQTLLPWKVLLNEDNGDIKTVMLAKVKINTNLDNGQKLFDTTPPDPLTTGWRVTIEPFK